MSKKWKVCESLANENLFELISSKVEDVQDELINECVLIRSFALRRLDIYFIQRAVQKSKRPVIGLQCFRTWMKTDSDLL